MSKFQVENAIDEFREGRIDEWELKREMEREYGSCSCMSGAIRKAVSSAEYDTHLDAMDLRSGLDRSKNSCDNQEYYGSY